MLGKSKVFAKTKNEKVSLSICRWRIANVINACPAVAAVCVHLYEYNVVKSKGKATERFRRKIIWRKIYLK